MLSYVIRRKERLALKDRSLTADKEHSWYGPTIREDNSAMGLFILITTC